MRGIQRLSPPTWIQPGSRHVKSDGLNPDSVTRSFSENLPVTNTTTKGYICHLLSGLGKAELLFVTTNPARHISTSTMSPAVSLAMESNGW